MLKWKTYPENKPKDCGKCLVELNFQVGRAGPIDYYKDRTLIDPGISLEENLPLAMWFFRFPWDQRGRSFYLVLSAP